MNVTIERENSTRQLDFTGTVKELLEHLKINSETVLITRNNEVLTEDEKLKNSDSITILSVISGG